ncbi:MAG: MAPEG family protein [Nitratireductor sp.]|nr:MAPEG family protein [Nitratireductor sp.]
MSIELKMLLYSTIVLVLLLIFQVLGEIIQNGLFHAMSARDDEAGVSGYAGRFERAFYNMLETFPVFAALVLMVEATESWTPLTALGAQLYFWGRVLYVPAYISGVPLVRTLIWAVSLVGILLFVWALLGVANGSAA